MVPLSVIELIGPAPKIGRPSWTKLGDLLDLKQANSGKLIKLLNPIKSSAAWQKAHSDEKFQIVLKAAQQNFIEKKNTKIEPEILNSADGQPILEINEAAKGMSLSWKGDLGSAFGEYLVEQLPELVKKFDEIQKEKP